MEKKKPLETRVDNFLTYSQSRRNTNEVKRCYLKQINTTESYLYILSS